MAALVVTAIPAGADGGGVNGNVNGGTGVAEVVIESLSDFYTLGLVETQADCHQLAWGPCPVITCQSDPLYDTLAVTNATIDTSMLSFFVERAGTPPSEPAKMVGTKCWYMEPDEDDPDKPDKRVTVVGIDVGLAGLGTAHLGQPSWVLAEDLIVDYPGTLTRLRSEVTPGDPVVKTAPLLSDSYVRLPTWLWIEPLASGKNPLGVRMVENVANNIRLQVFARPGPAVWKFSDGSEEVCAAGEMWAFTGGNAGDRPPCTHTYNKAGDYTMTGEVQWDFSAVVSVRDTAISPWQEGTPQTFGSHTASTSADVTVREIQAVN